MAKTGKGRKAPAKTAKAPKGKPAAPAKRRRAAAPPKTEPKRRRTGISGEQTPIPGTEQSRDRVLEREWLARKQAAADRKEAAERFAQHEANIQRRFEEIADADPDDPRAHAYRVDDGDLLRPIKKPALKVTRKPSREAKADSKARRSAAATADEPFLPDDDAEPEPEDLPTDREAYQAAPDPEPEPEQPEDEDDDDVDGASALQ